MLHVFSWAAGLNGSSQPFFTTQAISSPLLPDKNKKNSVSYFNFCFLFQLCEGCTKLERLTMDQCRSLTCASLLPVAQNCPNLRVISIEHNTKFEDAGVCELIQRCPLLEKLHLNSCGITFQTALHISHYCRNLTLLDLRCCSKLTDDVVKKLVSGCTFLEVLNVSLCLDVTDVSLEHIMSKCVALRGLYMVHCELTDKGKSIVCFTVLCFDLIRVVIKAFNP